MGGDLLSYGAESNDDSVAEGVHQVESVTADAVPVALLHHRFVGTRRPDEPDDQPSVDHAEV
nr:hypothetical protein [Streptomyces swartbergensis]